MLRVYKRLRSPSISLFLSLFSFLPFSFFFLNSECLFIYSFTYSLIYLIFFEQEIWIFYEF